MKWIIQQIISFLGCVHIGMGPLRLEAVILIGVSRHVASCEFFCLCWHIDSNRATGHPLWFGHTGNERPILEEWIIDLIRLIILPALLTVVLLGTQHTSIYYYTIWRRSFHHELMLFVCLLFFVVCVLITPIWQWLLSVFIDLHGGSKWIGIFGCFAILSHAKTGSIWRRSLPWRQVRRVWIANSWMENFLSSKLPQRAMMICYYYYHSIMLCIWKSLLTKMII